ncbi:UTRA domain-containing protein [Pseudonocardia sp. ICBG1293]|uniref:UTRA domain-containing protein n=1 Tax=Pseudonocardia sp. ICBG1293 TaxID=2844382 RepID=UPI001CCA88AB|nr:UTRA domain-containing protein [Pseudonocardia sp. ICBG1293]
MPYTSSTVCTGLRARSSHGSRQRGSPACDELPPPNITKGTQIEDDNSGPGGIYARLEELGYELSSYTERVSIGRADEQEAKQMNISPGEPVYRLWRTAWSSETPVEVNNITITGNRYELVYELPAN